MTFRLKKKIIVYTLSLVILSTMSSAQAVKLWKWVDKDGKVNYSETKPPPQAEQAEEKHIDPDRNVIQMEVPRASPPSPQQASSPGSGQENTTAAGTAGRQSNAAKGAATTTVSPAPPAVPQPPPPAVTPSVSPPPILPPPAISPPPIFPSPSPGGF